jgi:DNA-binding GntR family transcriptional regulator
MSTRPKRKLAVSSVTDALYRALREQILRGEIEGGAVVTEMWLAEQYSVARPTAKAAVERLVYEGLLHREHNKTARVPRLSARDISDLFRVRAVLERQAVGELARGRSALPKARRFLRDLEHEIDEPHFDSVLDADLGFHRALVDQLGSPRMSRIYDSLTGEVHLCMAQKALHHLVSPETVLAQHTAIVEATEQGDEKLAVRMIDEHLENSRERLVAYFEEDKAEGASASSVDGASDSPSRRSPTETKTRSRPARKE